MVPRQWRHQLQEYLPIAYSHAPLSISSYPHVHRQTQSLPEPGHGYYEHAPVSVATNTVTTSIAAPTFSAATTTLDAYGVHEIIVLNVKLRWDSFLNCEFYPLLSIALGLVLCLRLIWILSCCILDGFEVDINGCTEDKTELEQDQAVQDPSREEQEEMIVFLHCVIKAHKETSIGLGNIIKGLLERVQMINPMQRVIMKLTARLYKAAITISRQKKREQVLEVQVKDLKATTILFEGTIQTCDGTISHLQKEKEKEQLEVVRLNRVVTEQAADIESKSHELESVKDELAFKEADIMDKNGKIKELGDKLENSVDPTEVAKREAENKTLVQQAKENADKAKELQDKIDPMEAEKKQLRHQVKEGATKYKAEISLLRKGHSQEVQVCKDKIHGQERENKGLQDKAKQLEGEREELQTQLKEKEAMTVQHTKKAKEAEQRLFNSRSERARLQAAFDKATTEKGMWHGIADDATEKYVRLKEEVARLEKEKAELTHDSAVSPLLKERLAQVARQMRQDNTAFFDMDLYKDLDDVTAIGSIRKDWRGALGVASNLEKQIDDLKAEKSMLEAQLKANGIEPVPYSDPTQPTPDKSHQVSDLSPRPAGYPDPVHSSQQQSTPYSGDFSPAAIAIASSTPQNYGFDTKQAQDIIDTPESAFSTPQNTFPMRQLSNFGMAPPPGSTYASQYLNPALESAAAQSSSSTQQPSLPPPRRKKTRRHEGNKDRHKLVEPGQLNPFEKWAQEHPEEFRFGQGKQ